MMQTPLTGKQRAGLRAAANRLEPVFQIGKGEIDAPLTAAVDACLAKRELIKLTVLETSEYSAREAAERLAQATGAACVQVIGRRFVLFRPKPDRGKSAYTALLAR